jgi:hypothetical protein
MADRNLEQRIQGRNNGETVYQDPIGALHETNDALTFLAEAVGDQALSSPAQAGLAHILGMIRERQAQAIEALADRHPELEAPAWGKPGPM